MALGIMSRHALLYSGWGIFSIRDSAKIVSEYLFQFLPAAYGTIRRQFVKLIGKFSLSEKKFENFSIV